jgi:hypothetical protein
MKSPETGQGIPTSPEKPEVSKIPKQAKRKVISKKLGILTRRDMGMGGLIPKMEVESHMVQAKERALEYVSRGKLKEAINGMLSDLNKYSPDSLSPIIFLMAAALTHKKDLTEKEARDFIEGFPE